MKIIFACVVIVGLSASLLIHLKARRIIRENDAVLRVREDQISQLAAEKERLAALADRTETNCQTAPNWTSELAKLRAEVESLRQQSNQLAGLLLEDPVLSGKRFFVTGDSNLLDHNNTIDSSIRGGPRASGKLNDCRVVADALLKYAEGHDGEIPSSLDQVASFFPKQPLDSNSPPWGNAPLSGTNDFEIVYQGSLNDLSNIPARRVALIRERQPWPTTDGDYARVYGLADGSANTVESDDNFQSWEAQCIVPPPTD